MVRIEGLKMKMVSAGHVLTLEQSLPKHLPSVDTSMQAITWRFLFDKGTVAVAYGSYRATHFRKKSKPGINSI